MQVFKYYYKVIRKGAFTAILIYLAMSVALGIVYAKLGGTDSNKSFEAQRYIITVYDNDNSALSKNFTEYMKNYADIVDIKNNDFERKTALYQGTSNVFITIPAGFEESFASENEKRLDIQTLSGTASSEFCKVNINNYFSTFSMYKKTTDFNNDEINKLVIKDLDVNTKVTIHNIAQKTLPSGQNIFLNSMNYFIFNCLITSIITILLSFKKREVTRRINSSSTTLNTMNVKLIACHFLLTIIFYAIFMILSMILFNLYPTSKQNLLYYINIFLISLVAMGIGLVCANFIKKRFIGMFVSILGLGTAFLGGSFVPQEYLSDVAKYSALINPAYWFIKANNSIANLSGYTFEALKNILLYMSIEILFFIALITVNFVVEKQKRTSEN